MKKGHTSDRWNWFFFSSFWLFFGFISDFLFCYLFESINRTQAINILIFFSSHFICSYKFKNEKVMQIIVWNVFEFVVKVGRLFDGSDTVPLCSRTWNRTSITLRTFEKKTTVTFDELFNFHMFICVRLETIILLTFTIKQCCRSIILE